MKRIVWIAAAAVAVAACGRSKSDNAGSTNAQPAGDPAEGPASIVVPDFTISSDPAEVQKGQQVFASKGCVACHKVGGGKLVGPDLKGVTARRRTKWIERQIESPEVMLKEDETAKTLFKTYMTPMANQHVDPQSELPALLAYLKANES